MDLTERFADLLQRPDPEIALDEAALVIAGHADPSMDIEIELERLDRLAAGVRNPTLDGLVQHLFVDEGFAGNRVSYYDPRNSMLPDVVERRLGIPISLAVVAISVGRRIGIPLAGVGMPGHFLLRDKVDREVFVDPFAAGSRLDREGCIRIFRALQGEDVPFADAYLDPVGATAIVTRMLANLRSIYAATGDRASLGWVLRLRTLVPGSAPEDRGELAELLAASGRFDAAAHELGLLADELGGTLGDEYAARAGRLRARLN